MNTASALVLAALVPELSLGDVQQLLVQRKNIPFKDFADFRTRLPRPDVAVDATQLDTRSRFFSVLLRASYGRAAVTTEAMLDRQGIDWPTIVWQKFE